MTAGPDAPATGDSHTLTVESVELPRGGWRLVATCSCLNWARSAVVSTMPVAEVGHLMIADQHSGHLARVAAGMAVIQSRPSWLPPLGGPA